MEILQAIEKRHSVRSYLSKEIPAEIIAQLQEEIDICNQESGLNVQLVVNDTKAFDSMMARYGKFSGVENYIALIGKNDADFDELSGYYGERIALIAQMLGLNTCWVAMTFSKGATKKKCVINADEKLGCVIALGYGKTQGVTHKSKAISEVVNIKGEMLDWFKNGVEAALLAPTAMNQQKFMFELVDDIVAVKSTGGFYSKVDLGIVKYHFEIGTGIQGYKCKQTLCTHN